MKISEQNIYSLQNNVNHLTNNPSSVDSISLSTSKITYKPSEIKGAKSDEEIVATLERSMRPQNPQKKGILYKREQISAPVTTHVALTGTKLRPAEHYQNMLRAEAEAKIESNDSVSDEQMDTFLREAFKLFNSPNPFS